MACLPLVSHAGTSGPDPRIEGTSWVLASPADWDEPTRALLQKLAPRLPEAFRFPPGPLQFHIEDARAPDSDGGHTLAETHWAGTDITLYVRGLPEALAGMVGPKWQDPARLRIAAERLIARAVVHELTHVWDKAKGISSRDTWRSISGWSWLSFVPTAAPDASTGEFASPYGATSAAEDLATFAEVYFLPPLLGPTEAENHPRCRFPAKFRFFADFFPATAEASSNVHCPQPSEVGLSPEKVRSVEILWAAPTLSSLASVGGHLLLMLELETPEGIRRETFALLAETGNIPEGSALYVALGLAGGFTSRVVRDAYETTALKYEETEGRDVRRFRWKLTDAQKRILLARLDDLTLHWSRPYFFFQRNCSEIIIQLMNEIYEERFDPPPVIPPDLVLAELTRRGHLEPVPIDARRDLAPITRARLLSRERSARLNDLCGRAFPGADDPEPEVREAAWTGMLEHVRTRNEPECWKELSYLVLLSAPLESALRLSRGAATAPDAFVAADAACRQHVPEDVRASQLARVDAKLDRRAAAEVATGPAAAHTPYNPWWLGIDAPIGDNVPVPMLSVGRDAIRLERDAPRMFSSARGIDLTALSLRTAVGLREGSPLVAIRHEVLRVRYVPERVLPGIPLGVHLRLLQGEHRLWEHSGDVRWLEAGIATRLGQSASRPLALDAAVGLGFRTFYGTGGGSQLEAPIRVRLDAYAPGTGHAGLVVDAGWVPAVSLSGKLLNGAEAGLSAWVYAGDVRGIGVKLALSGEWRWHPGAGATEREMRVSGGIVLERY